MSRPRLALVAAVVGACLALAGCGTGEEAPRIGAVAPSGTGAADGAGESADAGEPAGAPEEPSGHAGHGTSAPAAPAALRNGERFATLRMPTAYTPSAPTGSGTDDYRCFLLDPRLAEDAFVTGIDVLPGNRDVVHHVILFRVPPDRVAAAEAKDAAEPGPGWTCFGGSGLDDGARLDDAPWLGAWAPGAGERTMPRDVGIPLAAGSRIVLQVHYNLLEGSQPDVTAAKLRIAGGSKQLTPLQTMLLPAPVELPCREARSDGPLCSRTAAMADNEKRFGPVARTADYLHLLCGAQPAGPTQTCLRTVDRRTTIRAAAGHMHLLGREIRIDVNPGTPRARTVLDIPVWNFDDQGARTVAAVTLRRGDTVRVTCRHDQVLRDLLPAFRGQPDRYVLWGEGTTDEMCLGMLLVTHP